MTKPILPPAADILSIRLPAYAVPLIEEDAKPSPRWRWIIGPAAADPSDGRDGRTSPAPANKDSTNDQSK